MPVRLVHQVPGRLRVNIPAIQRQPVAAYKYQTFIAGINGVTAVWCSAATGRALIHLDERIISTEQLMRLIQAQCEQQSTHPQLEYETVAAAKEVPITDEVRPNAEPLAKQATNKSSTANQLKATLDNPYFLPAAASGTLFGALAIKRMLVGRSLMAAAPVPFYAAAGLSIIAGYPALRRGIEGLIRERKLNYDLWMGIAALSMAALRENLVALSAITLVNIALYRRHSAINRLEATHLSPAVERHSERMSRLSILLAPLTLVLTRNPLKALGVLLAANSRPIIQAHKYRWARAEKLAMQKQMRMPVKGNLETLAAARTIVISNVSDLNQDGLDWQYHLVKKGIDRGKTAMIAASLLQKQQHPWRRELQQTAERDERTLRTPFDVEVSDEGVRGTINGRITVFGSKKFLKRNGVDVTAVLFEERKMRREGFKPHLLAQDGELLAIIGRKQEIDDQWKQRITAWETRGYSVRSLKIDERIPCALDTITLDELSGQVAAGKPIVMIGETNLQLHRQQLDDSPHFVVVKDEVSLDELLEYCGAVTQRAQGDLPLTKIWNALGTSLAIFTPITAPLVNLMTDAVGLFLLAKQEWKHTKPVSTGSATSAAANTLQTSEPFHAMESAQVLHAFHCQQTGLDVERVTALRKKYGYNTLQPPATIHPVKVFLGQFRDLSTVVLLGASGISLFMGEPFNALCMGGILIVNALMGMWQEIRSASVLQALKNQDVNKTRVVRDGTETAIAVSELVPGDIVLLEAGDMVPADIRLIDAVNLEVNEAMLTGESLPAAKNEKPLPVETMLSDRVNMLFMGTILTRGKAHGIVTNTGSSTAIGALQSLLNQKRDVQQTPLQRRISEISKHFVLGAAIAGGIVVAAGLIRGIPPLQLLISAVTLAASAIPEGLPLTITIALTAGVLRMAKRKTVVRQLGSLESLGRVTVICSDKTGTLTKNEMTVKELVTLGQQIHVSGDGFEPVGELYAARGETAAAAEAISSDINRLLTIGVLCNNSSIEKDGSEYKTLGDPTEIAILTAGMKAGVRAGGWTRQKEIPFDSYTKSMSVVCRDNDEAACMIMTKGSPEAVLAKSTHYLLHGETLPITEQIRSQIQAQNIRLAEQAYRVLGFAYRDVDNDAALQNAADEGLIFVGLMGMIDPPKEDVAASINEAKLLGVKTVMITGDHPITARAIAAQLGIHQPSDRIITGEELETLSAEQLAGLVASASVFARVTPEHKLRIVEAYQLNGEVVAMTGDGVNDAPAVRKADVGIAMGTQGTDITKDTAGIILLEDHFHSIVDGIKEGRTIIGNIRKAIGCLLTGNLAEVLVGATAVVVGLPMPLIPLQILLMNLLTDALPAMVLATDAKRSATDTRHNDIVDSGLYRNVITRGIVLGAGSLAVFAAALAGGVVLPMAQTMAFAALVAGQLIQTVSWRNLESTERVPLRQDRPLLMAMGASWVALLAAIYLPGMQVIFGTVPLGIQHWVSVLAVAGSVSTISSLLLKLQRKNNQGTGAHIPSSYGALVMKGG